MRQVENAVKNDLILLFLNEVTSRLPSRRLRLILYRCCFDVRAGGNILRGVRFRYRRHLQLGINSVINGGCTLDTRGGAIRIGNYVDIAPEVNIWTLEHDPHDVGHDTRGGEVTIEDYVWIANRAIVLPGVTLGRGAIVAAGAVVTASVAPMTIVAGVPARPIGLRANEQLEPRPPYRPRFL